MTETTNTETNTDASTDSDPEISDLGEAGKKAIAAERKRADALDKELKALREAEKTRADAELTELERFKREADELRTAGEASALEALRFSVALEKGLPANLAARLQGNDRAALEADADSLSELVGAKPTGAVRADHSQGTKATVGESDPAQAFAQALNQARGR